jgi:hypothetical protein
METTTLTINDYEYIPGDSLSDRQLLTESELMAEWDATHPLPNGKSWSGIPCIDGDASRREAKKRELIWMTNVLQIPIVNQNRLEPHWDIAMILAAHKAGIGYIPRHHYSE